MYIQSIAKRYRHLGSLKRQKVQSKMAMVPHWVVQYQGLLHRQENIYRHNEKTNQHVAGTAELLRNRKVITAS